MIYKAYDYKGKTYEANRNKIKDFVTGSELNGTDVTASKMTYDWNENSRLTYNGLANYNWSNENHNISALGGVIRTLQIPTTKIMAPQFPNQRYDGY